MTDDRWTAHLARGGRHAEGLMLQKGELLQTFIVHSEDEDRIIVAPYRNAAEKAEVLRLITLVCTAHNAQGITIISEAWMRVYDGLSPEEAQAEAAKLPPADDPAHREVVFVMVVYYAAAGGAEQLRRLSLIRDIVRNKRGKVTALAADRSMGDDEALDGAMMRLLPPRWPVPQVIRDQAAARVERSGLLVHGQVRSEDVV